MLTVVRSIVWVLVTLAPYVVKLATKVVGPLLKWGWPVMLAGGAYYLRDSINHGFKYLLIYSFDLSKPVVAKLVEDLPPVNMAPVIDLMPYVNMANYWFPFDYLLAATGSYMALWFAVMTYRLIKSWIPTVSG